MALNSLAPSSSINLQFSPTYIRSHPAIFTSKHACSSSSLYSSSLCLSQSIHCFPQIRRSDFKGSRRVKCAGKKDKLKVMISGAPASGKGTQCDLIVQKYDLVHISTGDLLRAEVASGTDIGKKAKEYMNGGQLVPDEIVTDMLMSRLSQQDVTEKGWLLDGYPRTSLQAQSLEKMNIKPDIFVLLDVPDEILIERCIGRRLDPVTRKIYHVKYFPPETEEISKRLVIRSDDTLEKVKSRLESYKRNTEAILSTYKDKLNKVDGNRSKDAVFSDIDRLLEIVLATAAKSRSLHSSNGDLSVGSPTASNLNQGKWRGIPTRLNNIPHSREIRNYFYNDVLQATSKAVEDKRIRLKGLVLIKI